MKIGIFTDTHFCALETLEQERKPLKAYQAVKEAYECFKESGVDVVVCLGDLVHYNESTQESLRHLEIISSLINSYEIPTYLCMGNHDNEIASAQDFEDVSGLKVAPAVAEDDDVRLIFLDASYYPDGAPYGRVYVDWTKSFIPQKQLVWLDKQLETNKKCVVFIHQNIDVNVEERHIVSNAQDVNSIIAKHGNVCGVYQGHYHQGAENVLNSIVYVTQRAMCIKDEINYRVVEV